jgi:type II secretory pathway pseudopilin PulG
MKPFAAPPPRPRRPARAFTLAEVMVAAVVLLFGLVTAITTMQRGLQAVDTSRNLALATQLMQTEIERLRLKSWAQLEELQNSGLTAVSFDGTAGAAAARFHCTRTIIDAKEGMKEITLVTQWNGYDGRSHTARLVTRYGKNGLNDYISTVH